VTEPSAAPDAVFLGLRKRLIALTPAEIGLDPGYPVWGALMELGSPEGVVSLAAVADGTTSLTFSSGGAILGAGEDQQVRLAAEAFLAAVEENLERLGPVSGPDLPLPEEGHAHFHALTSQGLRTGQAAVADIARREDRLLVLYEAGQEVLTQLRLAREAR
jgi:hypothetical protein